MLLTVNIGKGPSLRLCCFAPFNFALGVFPPLCGLPGGSGVENPPSASAGGMGWAQSLGRGPLEEEMATHSSSLPGKSHGQRRLAGYSPWGRMRISIETCILSRVKQITSPGWMHETGARAWCAGKTQRDGTETEAGGGIRMGSTCKSMADSCQCMVETTTVL